MKNKNISKKYIYSNEPSKHGIIIGLCGIIYNNAERECNEKFC